MVKQFKLGQTAEESNWILGEGIWGKDINGVGLRSMKAPGTAYDDPRIGKDPQPRRMADYKDLPNDEQNDFGGVHINSGIPNHAFYLVATRIGGYAWKAAGQIWYRALTHGKLRSDATFQDFADETYRQASKYKCADDTYAQVGKYKGVVAACWEEVGITVAAARLK